MPYDPTKPAFGSPDSSAEMRDQLNGLNDRISTIPVGPQGPAGPQGADGSPGAPGTNGVDGADGAPGTNGNDGAPGPQGPQGNDGAQGPQGAQGDPGPQGPQGPSVAAAVVDGVTTLNPGDPATVGTSFDGTSVHFTFGLPHGNDGIQGAPGNDGAQGQPGPQGDVGPQGPVGEVSNADLAAAIAGVTANSSANTNGVATLDTPFADPDTETLRQKVNEMILAQRR